MSVEFLLNHTLKEARSDLYGGVYILNVVNQVRCTVCLPWGGPSNTVVIFRGWWWWH